MVAPTTGPLTQQFLTGDQTLFWERKWWRQKKPYNLQLPFQFRHRHCESHFDNYHAGLTKHWTRMEVGPTDSRIAFARDLARERLVSKIREESAELAVGMAQYRQSADMIRKRANQLLPFIRNVKRGRFGDAFDALDLRRPSKDSPIWERLKRKHGRDLGDTISEFQFGWKPLVSDIGNAVEVLQKGVPPIWVKSRAKHSFQDSYSTGADSGWTFTVHSKVQCSAQVILDNPNLFLANKLGFVNPATFVWELIPWSFVVDWFVNVGDFLESFTEFMGLRIYNSSWTYYTVIPQRHETYYTNYNPPRLIVWEGTNVDCVRQEGLPPGPKLRVRTLERVSVSRAASAVGLLLQQLGKR